MTDSKIKTTPRFDTDILTETETKNKDKRQEPKKYIVVLHNDDTHSMDEVIYILCEIMSFDQKQATKHTLEAHKTGRSIVAMTHFERAEFYVSRLKSKTLVATMEKF